MRQKCKVITPNGVNFVPSPERVLVTSVCHDAYESTGNEMPSSVTCPGYQDGFGEYSTHLPSQYKIHTEQRSYGLSFLEANVGGPTYLQYPSTSELMAYMANGNYDVLAISAYTWSLPWAMNLAKTAREHYEFKEVWLGGYAVMTDEPQMHQLFDRLFWGYAESSFKMALGHEPISTGLIRHPDLSTRVSFLGKETTAGHILFRRGCSNSCNYCADPVFQPGGEGALSINEIETILDIYEEKNIRAIYFSNQETNLFTETGMAIVDAMSKRDMRFGMLTSFRCLNSRGADGIRRLYDKGLNFLLLGLESLNDRNLIKTGRKANYREMCAVLKLLQQMKVTVTTTYMICFEDDTPETIKEAKKKIIDELGVTVSLFNITMPLPGTPLYWDYKDKGMIWDWDWTHWTGNHLVWNHPFIAPELAAELLAEMRSEVNNPEFNPNLKSIWDARSKNSPSTISLGVVKEEPGLFVTRM
jgi:pyruvate-formate lyase-activating enzyme